jgi:hypothetical protein
MRKQRHDMTPDELRRFEEEIVKRPDERRDGGPVSESEIGREPDRNGDGLPDNPAKHRVPS